MFEQKYGKLSEFLSEFFHFLVLKCSVYLNRHVFVMHSRPEATSEEKVGNIRPRQACTFLKHYILILRSVL